MVCTRTRARTHAHTHTHTRTHTHTHTQMAGIAGADILNDRERFRNFFRTLPSFELVGPSLAVIARQFCWTQMTIISQEESLFVMVYNSSHVVYFVLPTLTIINR